MSEALETFRKLLNLFDAMVKGADAPGTFAMGLCGPKTILTELLAALLKVHLDGVQLDGGDAQRFQASLDDLDHRVGHGMAPPVYRLDPTLVDRWAGLSQLLRSCLVERSSSGYATCLKNARDSFDAVWKAANPDADSGSPSLADASKAKAADGGLFSSVTGSLQRWTAGSWMVWDVLSQWNRKAQPVAFEATPVLFAGGSQGRVMRLVVEALPGPPGLVTPNAWLLGLCAFDRDKEKPERFFLQVIQRMLRRAFARAPGLRFRWHLAAAPRDAWMVAMHGRSAEAAAAVAASAVLERYEELQQQPDEAKKSEPILDAHSVVTAVVGDSGASDPCEWRLDPVDKETLQAKLDAARGLGLDVVGVPTTQALEGVIVPKGVRIEPVATVGEAFDLLRGVNRAFERYGEYVRSQFRYYEEETPAKK